MPPPDAAAPSEPTFSSDLHRIWKMGSRVQLWLSFFSLGIPGALTKMMADQAGRAVAIWGVLAMTAPLTLALTILGVGLLRRWFASWWAFAISLAVCLAATAWLAGKVGMTGGISVGEIQDVAAHAPAWSVVLAVPLTCLRNYQYLYGLPGMLSSILVAGFLAWSWGDVILPRLGSSAPSQDDRTAMFAFLGGVALAAVACFALAEKPPEPKILQPLIEQALANVRAATPFQHFMPPVKSTVVSDIRVAHMPDYGDPVGPHLELAPASTAPPSPQYHSFWPVTASVLTTYGPEPALPQLTLNGGDKPPSSAPQPVPQTKPTAPASESSVTTGHFAAFKDASGNWKVVLDNRAALASK